MPSPPCERDTHRRESVSLPPSLPHPHLQEGSQTEKWLYDPTQTYHSRLNWDPWSTQPFWTLGIPGYQEMTSTLSTIQLTVPENTIFAKAVGLWSTGKSSFLSMSFMENLTSPWPSNLYLFSGNATAVEMIPISFIPVNEPKEAAEAF